MLRINRQIFNNIKHPNYIIFNSIIKTNFNYVHEEMKNTITFYDKDVKKIMSYGEVDNLFKKYNRQNSLLDYHKAADLHTKDFLSILDKYPKNLKPIFINEFATNTFFSRFYEDFNFTSLMRKFKAEPAEIFSFLVQPHKEFSHCPDFYKKYSQYQNFYIEQFKKLELERDNNDYMHFDYYNNIRLKLEKTIEKTISDTNELKDGLENLTNSNIKEFNIYNSIISDNNKNNTNINNINYNDLIKI